MKINEKENKEKLLLFCIYCKFKETSFDYFDLITFITCLHKIEFGLQKDSMCMYN